MLHYHKCHDCLTAFSSTESKIDECDCGGSVFYMGQVHGDRYVKTEDKPACDGRCTHACGPICDCKCGGANHGTGKVVQTVVAEGKIKAVGLTEEDIERAQIFRKLRDYAQNLYDRRFKSGFGSRENGGAANHNAWRASNRLAGINRLRVYKRRNEELIAFINDYK